MFSLWQLWLTTTNLSYTFPIFETSATASCGSTCSTCINTGYLNVSPTVEIPFDDSFTMIHAFIFIIYCIDLHRLTRLILRDGSLQSNMSLIFSGFWDHPIFWDTTIQYILTYILIHYPNAPCMEELQYLHLPGVSGIHKTYLSQPLEDSRLTSRLRAPRPRAPGHGASGQCALSLDAASAWRVLDSLLGLC